MINSTKGQEAALVRALRDAYEQIQYLQGKLSSKWRTQTSGTTDRCLAMAQRALEPYKTFKA